MAATTSDPVNGNSCLQAAKNAKDDEFYTPYEDVEKELSHYTAHFAGKTIYCNCDDPLESAFCRYFLRHFAPLRLKRLICTSYAPPLHDGAPILPFDDTDVTDGGVQPRQPRVLDVSADDIGGHPLSDEEATEFLHRPGVVRVLSGTGDFRSAECTAYLSQCDIVVTNPPFSLFREFVALVLEYGKKFLVIGGQNALTYKEIFPLIMDGQVWTGYRFGEMKFRVPADSAPRPTRYWVDDTGQKWRSLGNAMWLTNLDVEKRHILLPLTKKYTPAEYPRYDSYDAINVRTINEIPYDYEGIMGVPVTILSRYNADQFEIVGEANHGSDGEYDLFRPTLSERTLFKRILIRNRNPGFPDTTPPDGQTVLL